MKLEKCSLYYFVISLESKLWAYTHTNIHTPSIYKSIWLDSVIFRLLRYCSSQSFLKPRYENMKICNDEFQKRKETTTTTKKLSLVIFDDSVEFRQWMRINGWHTCQMRLSRAHISHTYNLSLVYATFESNFGLLVLQPTNSLYSVCMSLINLRRPWSHKKNTNSMYIACEINKTERTERNKK